MTTEINIKNTDSLNTENTLPVADNVITESNDGDRGNTDISAVQPYVRTVDSGKVVDLQNGSTCNGTPSELQVFVMRYDEKANTYSQSKLDDPPTYVLRDKSLVPPGDCVIVEFSPYKLRTERLCLQYGVRDKQRCAEFSGGKTKSKLCNISEVQSQPEGDEL